MIRSTDNARSYANPFEYFAAAILPNGLSDATVGDLRDAARQFSVAPGSPAPIDHGRDQFVFVAKGSTKLVAHVGSDREQVLSFHFPGELTWLPRYSAHDLALYATADCEIVTFPAQVLQQLGKVEPALLIVLLERCTVSLGRSRDKAILLGRKCAAERMADFLYTLAGRIGSAGTIPTLSLTMSRRDIADALGLTIETVSRQLGKLRLDGVIETKGRSIVRILDIGELAKRSGRSNRAE